MLKRSNAINSDITLKGFEVGPDGPIGGQVFFDWSDVYIEAIIPQYIRCTTLPVLAVIIIYFMQIMRTSFDDWIHCELSAQLLNMLNTFTNFFFWQMYIIAGYYCRDGLQVASFFFSIPYKRVLYSPIILGSSLPLVLMISVASSMHLHFHRHCNSYHYHPWWAKEFGPYIGLETDPGHGIYMACWTPFPTVMSRQICSPDIQLTIINTIGCSSFNRIFGAAVGFMPATVRIFDSLTRKKVLARLAHQRKVAAAITVL